MTDNLVDLEGYPRADLDVLTVRKTRVRVICEWSFDFLQIFVKTRSTFPYFVVSCINTSCKLTFSNFIRFSFIIIFLLDLQNDLKELLGKIEAGLYKIHADEKLKKADQKPESVQTKTLDPSKGTKILFIWKIKFWIWIKICSSET